MRHFFIFALPQSKIPWLAEFLTYKDWLCLNNISLAMKNVRDLDTMLERPRIGYADESLAMIWPEIVDRAPSARLVTIRKPVTDVEAEMAQGGWTDYGNALRRIDFALNEIESLSGTLRIDYDKLDTEPTAKRLFEHCLPYPFDREWWNFMRTKRVEQNPGIIQAAIEHNAHGYVNTFSSAARYFDKRLAEQRA